MMKKNINRIDVAGGVDVNIDRLPPYSPNICRAHTWPLVLLAGVFLILAAHTAIQQRHQTQQLNRQLANARQEGTVLRDERRSLQLEYATITDYDDLHNSAEALGMREPDLRDGTLVFFINSPPRTSTTASAKPTAAAVDNNDNVNPIIEKEGVL